MPKAKAEEVAKPTVARLYVVWAMQHLQVIDQALEELNRSNTNWMTVTSAVIEARTKLILENDDYKEAAWRLLAFQYPSDRDSDVTEIYNSDGSNIDGTKDE